MDDDKILRTDDGPANNDPTGDDCFVFIVSLDGIERIIRVRVD